MKTLLWCCLVLAAASARADDTVLADCGKNHYILDDPLACWQETGALNVPRAGHTATLLVDGRVLVVGGSGGDAGTSAEIYDPSTGHWTVAAPLHATRQGHTATRLANGRVLVLGGSDTYTVARGEVINNTGEIYDPVEDTWTVVPGPATPRDDSTATLLADGRVLIVGGLDAWDDALGSCELFDPATRQWATTGSLPQPFRPGWFTPIGTRAFAHTATLLADGRVLLAGGFDSDFWMNRVAETDLYDPVTGLWTVAAPMSAARGLHTATLLGDGRIMVTGGGWLDCDSGAGCVDGLLMTTEIYDPRTNAWSAGPPLVTPHEGYSSTLLDDGSLLLAGGVRNVKGTPYTLRVIGESELSPASGASWTAAPSLRTPRAAHTATLLRDGSVLVVGGYGDLVSYTPLRSAEIYRPPPGDSTP